MRPEFEERALIDRLRGGEPEAYAEFVNIHADRVYGVALRVLGNGGDAEDAVQDAFLAAWKGIRGFDGRAALSTWLHRIAVNSALAIRRSKTRKREIAMAEITPDDPDHPAQDRLFDWEDEAAPDPVEQADVARLVWDAVGELDDNSRLVLVLRDVEEMPSKEVANTLGVSDASVRQRLHRARQTVAEKLRPELCAGRRFTCGGRLDLLFDWIDQELASELWEPVGDHLASCPDCQNFLGQYRLTVAAPGIASRILGPGKAPEPLVRSILEKGPGPR